MQFCDLTLICGKLEMESLGLARWTVNGVENDEKQAWGTVKNKADNDKAGHLITSLASVTELHACTSNTFTYILTQTLFKKKCEIVIITINSAIKKKFH